jgi:flavin-binding protein dodecin
MDNQVFKVVELVGTSERSVEDAIQTAVGRAARTLKGLSWFEVKETRGSIADGRIAHYQVVLRVGFQLEDKE